MRIIPAGLILVILLAATPASSQSTRMRRVTSVSGADNVYQNPQLPVPQPGSPVEPPAPSPPAPQSPTPGQQGEKERPKKPATPAAPEPEAEAIRIDSTLVTVPVSVTDVNGQPIRDLEARDFHLEEEGRAQQTQILGDPGKTPLELALLFDVSRSVRNRFDFEKQAASRFLEVVMKPGDNVSVYSIGRSARVSIERTDQVETAIAGIKSIEPTDEATAFFDTVVLAARNLDRQAGAEARRVLVVISDGEDNNSENYRLADALRETLGSDCLFYSINPSGPSIRLNRMSIRGHEGMVRIANDTGGMAFLPDTIDDLTQVFNHIATELQAQYLLGYYPTNDLRDGKFRRIEVTLPRQPDLRIRSRRGYYAPKEE